MTKSTKHKRARKQDLNKIKLKLGKKLKKSQNETKTDFKARKIILKEQLGAKIPSSLITKKNLNVTELLSRLSHASVFVRQDGLNGLKELVLKNTKFDLGPHLSVLFKGLNPSILDTDHQIRTTAVRVIEALVMKIGAMVQPYFQLLSSHLSCAMVHLNTGVQSDSLQLMDVLLSHATPLVAQNANTILKNFFMLISRKIDAPSANTNPLAAYALISNPSSRLATIKWRIKLLKSLSRYLDAILGECAKLKSSVPSSPWQVMMIGSFPPLVKKEGARAAIQGTRILTDETEAKSFVQSLFPLLFQTWGEVNQKRHKERIPGTALDAVAIDLLRYITEIVVHMWKIIEIVKRDDPRKCDWFMKILNRHLESDILDGFPYVPFVSAEKSSKEIKTKSKVDIDAECHSLNITLSSLAFIYAKDNSKLRIRVADYYIKLFNSPNAAPVHKLYTVAITVSSLFGMHNGVGPKKSIILLSSALTCFKNVKEKSRYQLLKLPLQASDYTCRFMWSSVALKKWIEEVVKDAIENPRERLIFELMLQFKLRNTPGFAQAINQNRQQLKEKIEAETSNNLSNMTVVL